MWGCQLFNEGRMSLTPLARRWQDVSSHLIISLRFWWLKQL